jgi:pimeloyl-ACP methyl ester carboxylesterase
MKYEIIGIDTTSPIVLVPGGLSGWVSWKPHAEVLSKNHKVIRVQLLNMAAAEKNQTPEEGYSLRSESVALKNTLDKIGIANVNLVGWSHGGEVSLDFSLNHPDHAKTLTLIEPAAYWVAKAYGQFADEGQKLAQLFHGFHDPPTEEDLIGFLKMNGLVPPGVDPKTMPRWPVWNSLKTALLSLHTVTEHSDDIARLQSLREKPVLLVKGKESVGFNSGIVDLLSKAVGPTAKVLILPDGHACHIVAMDQFISELERFLAST